MQILQSNILELEADPYIPKSLVDYYKNCINNRKENSLTRALFENKINTVKALSKMFQLAENHTGYDVNYIFEMTGLSVNDFDEARVDAALAEVRVLNYLGEMKFINFELIHDKHKRQSDIVAFYGNKKYCVEVTTIAVSGRQKWEKDELIMTIYNKFIGEEKRQQLINTFLNEGCDKMLFMVVILKEKAVALKDRNDYINILKEIHTIVNDEKLHIGILTGKKALGVGPDECVWPEL